jgi:hypothetical protein
LIFRKFKGIDQVQYGNRIAFVEKVNSIEEKKMNRQKRKTNITIAALKVFLGAALLMLVLSAPAYADSIVLTGVLNLTSPSCGNQTSSTGCPTATYTFTIGTEHATLDIKVTGGVVPAFTGPPPKFQPMGNSTIQGVNLGFTSASDIPTLTATPGSTTAGGTWTFATGALNNSGCQTTSSAGFVCSFDAVSAGFAYTVGSTYSWTWNYNAINPNVVFSVGNVHVGANYGPQNGLIVSSTGATSPTPEPGSLTLLGTGLVSVAGFVRRRMRTNA